MLWEKTTRAMGRANLANISAVTTAVPASPTKLSTVTTALVKSVWGLMVP